MRCSAFALTLVITFSGCRAPDGPAERYRAFTAAARAGDAEGVWSMLSERSRAELDERARRVAERAPPGVVPASGKDLVLGDLAARAPKPSSIVVVRESRDAAVLTVATEGGAPAREVALVREHGAWRVAVPFGN